VEEGGRDCRWGDVALKKKLRPKEPEACYAVGKNKKKRRDQKNKVLGGRLKKRGQMRHINKMRTLKETKSQGGEKLAVQQGCMEKGSLS